ncbi:type II secretion system protein [Thermosipho ferrireducens]|uniref:Type II secretion system protein n=1 Tax=Thermosipho ferrireducens TaxID=2571116 RepID=A0ABX7S858_9BACT|nr:type II secretion system protein [Thermosipho ferrireducens]QTA38093.1 type II secretion system protein [Thermosipho ferrireducens]
MKKGFTLIELLIVLAIISALLAVATPTAMNAVKKAKATQVAANLRNLSVAINEAALLYADTLDASGNIVEQLYDLNFIDVDLSKRGYEIVVVNDAGNEYYEIRYKNQDVEITYVKNILPDVKEDSGGNYIYLRVPRI